MATHLNPQLPPDRQPTDFPSDATKSGVLPVPHANPHAGHGGLALVETNEEGVDLTLIRWFLSLSVDERFEELQRGADSLAVLDAACADR